MVMLGAGGIVGLPLQLDRIHVGVPDGPVVRATATGRESCTSRTFGCRKSVAQPLPPLSPPLLLSLEYIVAVRVVRGRAAEAGRLAE